MEDISRCVGYEIINLIKFNVAIATDLEGKKCVVSIKPYDQAIEPYIRVEHKNVLKLIRYFPIVVDDGRFLQTYFGRYVINDNSFLQSYFGRYGTKDLWYIITEFVEGENFEDAIIEKEASPEELSNIATQLFAGLRAIHEGGFVHQDLIWAENIIVTENKDVVILDVEGGKLNSKDQVIKDIKDAAYLLVRALFNKEKKTCDDRYYQLRELEEESSIHDNQYSVIVEELLSYYPLYYEVSAFIIAATNLKC